VTDDEPKPESLEETYRRRSPYQQGASGVAQPPLPPARILDSTDAPPPGPFVAPQSTTRERRRRNRPLAFVVAGIAAALVIVIGAVVAVRSVSSIVIDEPIAIGPTETAPADEWTSYPGDAYVSSADVLDDPRLEQIVEQAEAFVADYQAALTAELGLTWAESYPEYLQHGTNGYGGTSLLYDYDSAQMQGTVALDEPDARERVHQIFVETVEKYGALDEWFSNELYTDDPDASTSQFGAEALAEQPVWSFYATDGIVTGSTMASRVYDSNLPRDPSFEGEFWFELEDVPSGSLVVTVSFSAYHLLATADEAEFTDRLADYDEDAKPAGR